jgi:hypothetical protein
MPSPDVNAVIDVAHLIQVALTPIFLMTAIGVTLNVLTNRLARIVDRARRLEDAVARGDAMISGGEVSGQLRALVRRSRCINAAITLIIASGLLIALVVVMLFLDSFLRWQVAGLIAVVFVLSMLSLAASLLAFLVEVRIATASVRIGVDQPGYNGSHGED